MKQCQESSIAAGGIREFSDIVAQLLLESRRIEILHVDGDLGLQRVNSTTVSLAGARSATLDGRGFRYFTAGRCSHSAANHRIEFMVPV